MEGYSLRPFERAKRLFDEAERLGLQGPTEDMIAEAINTAQSEAVLHTAGSDAHTRWYDSEAAGIDAVTGNLRDDDNDQVEFQEGSEAE